MAKIALINPRFEPSYWGFNYSVQMAGKYAMTPVSALPLLASLTPDSHTVVLIDENVEEIDFSMLDEMDIIGLTGMSVQRFRLKEILTTLTQRKKFVVVGGAWVTVQEEYFDDLADVVFVGEADETWPAFLRDWENGTWHKRYEQTTKTDMTQLPTPRFDLLKMDRYVNGAIQISRGCPFRCEFCDIIVTFGRRPRIKTAKQVIAELDALRTLKISTVFIVDDNFIGNKHLIKDLLGHLIEYQQINGYPFRLFTEASLDLAEDDELLHLMAEANFGAVFIGIESPNEASLRETRKTQNVRSGTGTMLDRVRKVQRAGLEVWCGMIVGFDNDDSSIFDAQLEFLKESRIPYVMFGMLYAIPKTPLHARLSKEGRLDFADQPEFGTNVIPLQVSRDALLQGYRAVMRSLYEPNAYFRRVEGLYLDGYLGRQNLGQFKYLKGYPLKRLRRQAVDLIISVCFFYRLMRGVESGLRDEYLYRLRRMLRSTWDPDLIRAFLGKCITHYHFARLSEDLEDGARINTL